MFESNDISLLTMQARAERELAAFLRAISEMPDQNNMPRASDAWLQTMESLDCPVENYELFFRRVTIRTISQLIADHRSPVRNDQPEREASCVAVARTAA